MLKLSVVIITLNEEKKLGNCLESLKGVADEIVVVDSHSKDKTEEIAGSYGAKVIQHPFEGYIGQKNFALDQAAFDHVLSLDADEVLSPQLRKSILEVKENWTHDGYSFNRLTNYCGSWVRHCGWYPDVKLRMVDRRTARWTGLKIHEKMEMKAGEPIRLLKGDLLHYSYDSIAGHIRQINHFTNLTSRELFIQGRKAGIFKIFYSLPVRFCRDYFFKLGFLDGYHGFLICSLSAWASRLKYAKLKALWDQDKSGKS